MKTSGAKIIIKPRLGKDDPIPLPEPDGPESEEDADMPDDETVDQATPGDAASENASGDLNDADDGDDGELEDEGDVITTGKGRGRPRGRGKAPTITAGRVKGKLRAVIKGRGRGRGRGGPLTIRLPGRQDDENQGDGEVAEAGKEVAVEEVEEKEEPLGGGKPFRKIQGKVYIIENDEFITDDDPKGDTKMDANGVLLGGRRFKASTFILPNRHPERRYMLAIDAARTSGFRDSLYYFRRNLLAFKLNATQPEKEYLIAAGKLGSHLRTRSVTLITARSAYKLHGAKMIIDGRWVEDDYYEEKSLEEITSRGLKAGDPVGELPDPSMYASESASLAAAAKAGLNAQAKADRGGTSGIYRVGLPTTLFGGPGWGPYSDGPLNAVRKSMLNRDGLNEENWMFIAAKRTNEAGDEWAKIRREALKACGGVLGTDELRETKIEGVAKVSKKRRLRKETDNLPFGVYEPHGGIVHYRTDTQPTRCQWEVVNDSGKPKVLGGTKTGNGAWALAWVDTVMELPGSDQASPGEIERDMLIASLG